MRRARTELGEDAVILNSRPASPEASHLGAYEVVFGCDDQRAAETPESNPSPVSSGVTIRADAVDLIRKELRQITRYAWNLSPNDRTSASGNDELLLFLRQRGLSGELAQEAISRLGNRVDRKNDGLRQALDRRPDGRACFDEPAGSHGRAFAQDLAAVDPSLGPLAVELEKQIAVSPIPSRDAIAFVGPPGAGKTTMLVKTAVRLGARLRRSVRIVCADGLRIGAMEQLRRYAAILGAAFEFHETPAALTACLAKSVRDTLTLVDLPGFSPGDRGEMQAWARALNVSPVEVHLVLPATWGIEELDSTSDLYGCFEPQRLAATHLDHAECPGRLITLSLRHELPFSFLSFGQSIPEDLEAASASRLVDLLVGRTARAVKPAAGITRLSAASAGHAA